MPLGAAFQTRGAMLGSHSARPPPSRKVGYTHVCFFLILGMGSVLCFTYQSEIYLSLAGKQMYSTGEKLSSRPLSKRPFRPEIKVENNTSRPRQKTSVFAEPPVAKTLPEVDSGVEPEEAIVQRKLESNEFSSSSSVNSSARNSTSYRTEPPARINKNDKKKAVDLTNKNYVPLVENVHSNLISTKFKLVIKVLAVNNHGSLLRCLNSLTSPETDYAGDTVDVHIYIDHFEINEAAESQKRQRRILLQSKASPGGREENARDFAQILEIGSETLSTEAEEESEDSFEGTLNESQQEKYTNVDSVSTKAEKKTDRTQKSKGRKKSKHSGTRKLGGGLEIPEEPKVPDKVDGYLDAVHPKDWGIIETKLRDARRVLSLADKFEWKHGAKVVHYRSQAAGYQGQWIDSWWPTSDDEFALVVEDDMELSPLFYRYVRSVISTYYYQPSQFDPSLYGLSLQRPQLVPGKSGQAIKVDDRTRLYMYEMVGIWGQVLFPRQWKEFRTWYDTHKSHDQKPILEGMLTTDWYREYGEKMWTPWFVKFVHTRGYFNMYTNFLKDRVMSVTHRSEGAKTKKYAGCDSSLIWSNSTYDVDIWHMAPMKTIKRYDYCFKEVKVGRFANKSTDFSQVLSTVHDNKVVLMLSTLNVSEPLVRNWICVLKKLGISNYVFFGDDSLLLEDLARRGHAALRTEFSERLTEHYEKEVHAVLTVLKLGYDVWFARTDMIWVGNPLSVFDESTADLIGLPDLKLNMFYSRSARETIDLWGSFYRELDVVVHNTSRQLNFQNAREAFVQKRDSDKNIRVQGLDKLVFLKAQTLTGPPSEDGVVSDAQVVLFSGLRDWTQRDVSKKATQLNLWNLDEDLVCTRVIC